MSKLLLQVPNTNEKCHIILSSEHNHNSNPPLLRRGWLTEETRAKAPRVQRIGKQPYFYLLYRHRLRIFRANQCSLFLSKFPHLDFSIGDFGTIKPWLTAYMANLEIESKPDLSSIEVMCCFTIDSDMFKLFAISSRVVP